ncbi:MAG: DMT family transporter [Gemmatimonadales bacterium]|nr:DMT family transporter [Gemmatimonadales bacterium]
MAALLFSTGGAAIKLANFTSWQIVSFRSAVAALVLAVALPAARRGISARSVLVGVAYAATLTFFVLANRLTTSANAIYLQSTAPLFLLLLGPWLLREPLRRRDIPVLLAVLLGLVLVMLGRDAPSGTAPNPGLGNAFAIASGGCYALMLSGLRWLGRDGDARREGLAAVVLGNALAALAALPMSLPLAPTPLGDWGVIVYLGAFQIGVAYVLVTAGLRRVAALDASLLLLVETALNPAWTWLLLRERPTPWAIAGGTVIIGATALQALRSATPPTGAKPCAT